MAYESRGRARGGSRSSADTIRIQRDRAGFGGARAGARGETMAAEAITFPLLVGAVHWIVVQLAASLAHRFGTAREDSAPYSDDPAPMTGLAHTLVEPVRQWDGFWYKNIAEQGYGGFGIAKAAFWPLYPWLMEFGSDATGAASETVGYVLSNLAFVVALGLLYRLVALDFDRAVARRTLWAIALFPTALFFSAVYTESLFLMLAVGALLAARLGRWWLAGLVGLLAALTRSQGVLLLLPFAVLFLQQNRFDLRRWFPNAIGAALPALGPVIFGWHLERVVDDPKYPRAYRAFIDVQEQWNRYSAAPWETLRAAVSGSDRARALGVQDSADWGWIGAFVRDPSWNLLTSEPFRSRVADSDTLELVCTLGFLALAVVGLRLLPLYQSAYLLPGLLIPLFGPSSVHALMSMPRFGLVMFPLFVVVALLVRERRVGVPLAIASAALVVVLTSQFALWYWVS